MARSRKHESDTEALLAKTSLPPASEWRRAPYLRSDGDIFWANIMGYVPLRGNPSAQPLLLSDEISASGADMVDPSSLVRLRIERGDYPFSQVQYKANIQPPRDWGDWVSTILDKFEHRVTLDRVGLLKTVQLSQHFVASRPQRDLDFAVSRWSPTSHTFIFPFGEAAPTLLDTEVLMGLPTRGEYHYDPATCSSEVKAAIEFIEAEFKAAGEYGSRYDNAGKIRAPPKANKTTWGSWQRYWFRDIAPVEVDGKLGMTMSAYHGGPLSLAAFLVQFLSLFLFPDFPHEGPRREMIPLAAVLAAEKKLPLGPMFLGHLYRQLDRTAQDFERSMGRYEITSMIHISFLLGFFYEYFPAIAPSPRELPPLKTVQERNAAGDIIRDARGMPILRLSERVPRIMRWAKTSSSKLFEDWCDEITSFNPRPYEQPADGALGPAVFLEDTAVDFQSKSIRSHKLDLLAWVTPSYLPTPSAEGPIMVLYRADRLQLQFGYDQGVPREPPSPPKDFITGTRRFLKSFNHELTAGYGGDRIIPSSKRKAAFTPENRVYWARNLQSFASFVQTPAVVPPAEPISKKDLTLRTFKPGKDPDWRGPQSCWVKGTAAPLDVISAIPIQRIRPADMVVPSPQHITAREKKKAEGTAATSTPRPPTPADKRKAEDLSPLQIGRAPKRARVR
jgi:hypothetical protein